MIGVFLAIPILASLLILPGFMLSDRVRHQPRWLFALPPAACMLWLAMVLTELRPKTLSNIVELFGIAAIAIVSCYIKFFVLDKLSISERASTLALLVTNSAAVMSIFFFVPWLPE